MSDRDFSKVRRPHAFSASELAKAGVDLVDEYRSMLQCMQCGHVWVVLCPGAGKRLANGWWKCPEGCNEPE